MEDTLEHEKCSFFFTVVMKALSEQIRRYVAPLS